MQKPSLTNIEIFSAPTFSKGTALLATFTEAAVLKILSAVCDPEIPVLSILDLGIVRGIHINGQQVEVMITPTYSGCPAMDMISMHIKLALIESGYQHIKVTAVLAPAWTTEWMSDAGKEKLKAYGIAPPVFRSALEGEATVECPQCHSSNTRLISEFGSTACKALYQCHDCKEPFDYFKCH